MAKLDVKAFGLAVGIFWGASLFIMGIVNMLSGYGAAYVEFMATIYIGYKATVLGSITGAMVGFIDAGIGAAIVAWLYNKLAK